MSRLLFALLFLFTATLSAADLVKNGKAVSVIVIGEKPTKSAQLAAYEIQYHIAKKTGVTLPIAAKAEKGKLPICVGGMNGFKSQEYLVDIKPGKIILAGCDAQESGKVNYADEKSFPSRWKECATLYAVYDFLEMAGFRWYIPTDIGTTFTPSKNLSIAEKTIRRTPSYSYRDYPYFNFANTIWADSNDWKNRNFLNKREAELYNFRLRVGGKLTIINHSLVSFNERFKTDPAKKNWFAQGYPVSHESQICYSNPEVIAQAVKDARDYFDGKVSARKVMGGHFTPGTLHDPKVFTIVPNDNGYFCRCKSCAKWATYSENERKKNAGDPGVMSGLDSDLFFSFANAVAKEVKKSHPDCKIALLAYNSYCQPPKTFKLESNIMIRMCLPLRSIYSSGFQKNLEIMKEWQKQYPGMEKHVWFYYCWPSINVTKGAKNPFPGYFASHLDKIFEAFDGANVTGLFIENSKFFARAAILYDTPEFYIAWRLAFDRKLKGKDLFDEFFRNYYGPAEKPMKEFYLLAEKLYGNPANYPKNVSHWTAIPHSRFITPANLKKFDGFMAQAKTLAKTGPYKERVLLFEKGIWNLLKKELREEYTRTPTMQQETIHYFKNPVPGNPKRAEWNKQGGFALYGGLRGENAKFPIGITASHDGTYLYLRFYEARDTSNFLVNKLGAWRDDGWELFFAKQNNSPYRQMNILASGKHHLIDIPSKSVPKFKLNFYNGLSKGSWMVWLAIPLSEVVPGGIKPGEILYFNAIRAREYVCHACWIPTYGGYFVPGRFGELYLEPVPVK